MHMQQIKLESQQCVHTLMGCQGTLSLGVSSTCMVWYNAVSDMYSGMSHGLVHWLSHFLWRPWFSFGGGIMRPMDESAIQN